MSKQNSWVEKHRPTTWDDIQGNNKAVKHIRQWAEDWSKGDKPQLLVGEPGTGKTTTATVVSEQLGYPLNQINASSARTSDDIKSIVSRIRSKPANAEHQLVLLDEVDSWHHSVDASSLYDALANPRNPIMLTGNVEYDIPAGIKRKAKTHKYKLGKRSRKAKIKEIAAVEDIDLNEGELSKLVERPDLRTAINDLQLYSQVGEFPGSDTREWEMSEFDAVDNILRGNRDVGSNINPEDLVMWLDENLSTEFRGIEAGIAYDALSRADIWLERARRNDYRYWKYAGELAEMTADVRVTEAYEGYINKDFPEWFRHKKPQNEYPKEYTLFQELKKSEEDNAQLFGSFPYFKSAYLPILKSLDETELNLLALNHGLSDDAKEGLGLDPREYDDFVEREEATEGEWKPDQQSAMDGW